MGAVAIIGAGAMGSLWGARLSPLVETWLIDPWLEHVQAMQTGGLHLIGLDGREETIPVQAASDPAAVKGAVDLAIIFVKSHGTGQAAHWASSLLARDGPALSMQNGLGNVEIMASILGKDRAVQGVTSHGATLVGPGRVRHAGAGPTYLAIPAGREAEVARIQALFEQAGFETSLSENLDSLVWGKLVINAGINALTAILRVPNRVLVEVESAEELMVAAVEEAVQVAAARGIGLPYADPPAEVRRVAAATGSNRSSMLSDVARSAPTEIDVINGAIVREGQRVGLDTPVNRTLVRLIKAMEASYGSQIQ